MKKSQNTIDDVDRDLLGSKVWLQWPLVYNSEVSLIVRLWQGIKRTDHNGLRSYKLSGKAIAGYSFKYVDLFCCIRMYGFREVFR